jgi:hypothetical protein
MVRWFICLMGAMSYGEMVEFGVLTRFWAGEKKQVPHRGFSPVRNDIPFCWWFE